MLRRQTGKFGTKGGGRLQPYVEIEQGTPCSSSPPPPPKILRIARISSSYQPNRAAQYISYSSVEKHNEDLATRFLFGNGLPLETIDDSHFQNFLQQINPSRLPPEPSTMTTQAHGASRVFLKYEKANGPLTITMEAVKKSDEVFITISVHYFDPHGERQNTVHFEKIISADYEGKVVADRLQRIVDPRKSSVFTNVVSPNMLLVQQISSQITIKNRFICFFQYLSNIAREVLLIAEFADGLRILRQYVQAIRRHPEVYTKFKKLQLLSANPLDLPVHDVHTEWLSTLQFLSNCGHLNEDFSNIKETWCMPKYLTRGEENAMGNLVDFLSVLCHVATEICQEDSCASQVLYSMSIINNSIESCGISSARDKMRLIFTKYYQMISKGKIGDFYSISSLLDPRFGYSTMIFSEEDWANVEQKMLREAKAPYSDITTKMHAKLGEEIEIYRELLKDSRPVFGEDDGLTPFTWWSGIAGDVPVLYKRWMEYSGTPAVSVDGKRFFSKEGKLAHLFSTLDEALHHKAMLLAQSSQNFVGRGYQSVHVASQIKDRAASFRRLEPEMESAEPDAEHEIEAEQDVKIEPALLEPKQEVLEEDAVQIKIEEEEGAV